MSIDDFGMITPPPSWSMMIDEAKLYLDLLDRVLEGPLTPDDHNKFFEELPTRIGDACAGVKRSGARHACLQAIKVLRNRNGRKLDYVDKELVSQLRQVLTETAIGAAMRDAILGQRTLTPKFAVEATRDLLRDVSLQRLLTEQALSAPGSNPLIRWTPT
jgi:hypothetical protein